MARVIAVKDIRSTIVGDRRKDSKFDYDLIADSAGLVKLGLVKPVRSKAPDPAA